MSTRGSRLLFRVLFALSVGFSQSLSPTLAEAQQPGAAADADHGAHVAPPTNFNQFVPGAAELEGRIIAPCCWNQTIDIHGSEVSTSLRQEIRSRLLSGENPEAIQLSLVERYGPRILAVPPGSRLSSAGILLSLAMGVGGVFAMVLLRRWQRRSTDQALESGAPGNEGEGTKGATPATRKAGSASNNSPEGTQQRARLDAEIDAELAKLDAD
ncbi:MAG TPA: cytochrome c-type biogenesis protein CcmH [Polyangiaceae bacterium]|nr:cytochrome c-type biogenesis protein CcmH [Polyangiaceae bacterium]